MSAVTPLLPPNGLTSSTSSDEIVCRCVRTLRAPTANDRKYPVGTLWIDKSGQDGYLLVSITNNAAVWKACT